MGDGGSLFIGAILGTASLIPWFGSPGSVSPWSLAILVPFIVPVGETAFVSSLRWMAGRNPARGGVDHPSHRLVAMGFSERRAVLLFYVVTLACGAVSALDGRVGAHRPADRRCPGGRCGARLDSSGARADLPGRRLRRAAARAVRSCADVGVSSLARGPSPARSSLDHRLLLRCLPPALRRRSAGDIPALVHGVAADRARLQAGRALRWPDSTDARGPLSAWATCRRFRARSCSGARHRCSRLPTSIDSSGSRAACSSSTRCCCCWRFSAAGSRSDSWPTPR